MRGIICDTDPAVRDEAPQAYKDLGQARLRGLDGLGPGPRVWGFCVSLRFGSKIWRLGLGVWGSGCATWLCISKGMVFPNQGLGFRVWTFLSVDRLLIST